MLDRHGSVRHFERSELVDSWTTETVLNQHILYFARAIIGLQAASCEIWQSGEIAYPCFWADKTIFSVRAMEMMALTPMVSTRARIIGTPYPILRGVSSYVQEIDPNLVHVHSHLFLSNYQTARAAHSMEIPSARADCSGTFPHICWATVYKDLGGIFNAIQRSGNISARFD